MLRAFEPWHLVVIGVIAMLLFGAKRLPDSARSVGQSLRIFRSEMAASAKPGAETEQVAPAASTAPASAPAPIAAAAPIAPAAPIAQPVPVATVTPSTVDGQTHITVSVPASEPVAAARH